MGIVLVAGMMHYDIGPLIKHVVDAQHWNYSDFARAINVSRSSVYNIFSSSDISIGRLLQISRVLNYDFIKDIVEHKCDGGSKDAPYITLPIRGRRIDLSDLPDEIISLIRSEL